MDRDEDDRVHTEELTRVALLDQPPPPPGSKRIRRAPTIPDGYIPSQAMPASIAAQFMMNVTDELDTCTPEPVNQPRFRQPSTTEPDQFGLSRVYPDDPETPPEGPSSDQGKADDNLTSAASMRKLAARDFEDLLQCALPVFEGLLPSPHNERVLDLLFALVEWHAYAKLRLHTDTTLKLFEKSTVDLGRQVRLFKRTTCEAYNTKELPQEIAARGRRKAALAKKGHIPRKQTQEETGETSKTKTLNINTYKFHAIGHYPASIKQYGTTDSHSTQIVSRDQLSMP